MNSPNTKVGSTGRSSLALKKRLKHCDTSRTKTLRQSLGEVGPIILQERSVRDKGSAPLLHVIVGQRGISRVRVLELERVLYRTRHCLFLLQSLLHMPELALEKSTDLRKTQSSSPTNEMVNGETHVVVGEEHRKMLLLQRSIPLREVPTPVYLLVAIDEPLFLPVFLLLCEVFELRQRAPRRRERLEQLREVLLDLLREHARLRHEELPRLRHRVTVRFPGALYSEHLEQHGRRFPAQGQRIALR